MKSEVCAFKPQTSDFRLEQSLDKFHILPYLALRGGVAQDVRRVKGGNELGAAEIVDAPAQTRNRVERPQQRLRPELSQRDNHPRLDDIDLLKQKRFARLDFVRLRIAVARRPALDDVRDVHVVALQANRLDDSRQQLTGPADERNALDVLVRAWSLADEHQVGVGIANAEHNLPPPHAVQLAPRAVADIRADGGERVGGIRGKRHGLGLRLFKSDVALGRAES